jgi:hypothetical protein
MSNGRWLGSDGRVLKNPSPDYKPVKPHPEKL